MHSPILNLMGNLQHTSSITPLYATSLLCDCHKHRMSATTNRFFLVKNEWPEKVQYGEIATFRTRPDLAQTWTLSVVPGLDPALSPDTAKVWGPDPCHSKLENISLCCPTCHITLKMEVVNSPKISDSECPLGACNFKWIKKVILKSSTVWLLPSAVPVGKFLQFRWASFCNHFLTSWYVHSLEDLSWNITTHTS